MIFLHFFITSNYQYSRVIDEILQLINYYKATTNIAIRWDTTTGNCQETKTELFMRSSQPWHRWRYRLRSTYISIKNTGSPTSPETGYILYSLLGYFLHHPQHSTLCVQVDPPVLDFNAPWLRWDERDWEDCRLERENFLLAKCDFESRLEY